MTTHPAAVYLYEKHLTQVNGQRLGHVHLWRPGHSRNTTASSILPMSIKSSMGTAWSRFISCPTIRITGRWYIVPIADHLHPKTNQNNCHYTAHNRYWQMLYIELLHLLSTNQAPFFCPCLLNRSYKHSEKRRSRCMAWKKCRSGLLYGKTLCW